MHASAPKIDPASFFLERCDTVAPQKLSKYSRKPNWRVQTGRIFYVDAKKFRSDPTLVPIFGQASIHSVSLKKNIYKKNVIFLTLLLCNEVNLTKFKYEKAFLSSIRIKKILKKHLKKSKPII